MNRVPTTATVILNISLAIFVIISGLEPAYARGVPSSVQSRFILGDPVWKEIVVRDELIQNYEGVWKHLVEILIDNNFEIGYMEKDSGYVRTNENAGIVILKKYWTYDIKVVAKIVLDGSALKDGNKIITKIRIQVMGHVYKQVKGTLRESYSGYDKIVLQDLFNDLQLVFGNR